MELVDLGWAAGFYEGEGHLSKSTGNGGPLVSISQCNREPLEKIQSLFGGQIYGPKQVKGGNQDVFIWQLTKHSVSKHFMYSILPWLSSKKQEDALNKIEYYVNKLEIRKAYCGNGHYRTEENTRIRKNGARDCRLCDKLNKRRKAWKEKHDEV